MNEESLTNAIAIVGMSGKFPGADDVQSFWANICEGKDTITTFSNEQLKQAGVPSSQIEAHNYIKSRGTLNGIEFFDAEFFGIKDKEAQFTDPQHRLFLECAWNALESAGYSPEKYEGAIGVYAGSSPSSYYLNNIHPNPNANKALSDFLLRITNDKDYLTTKVSHKLNLKGPSIAVQTACSSSLVSICLACDHLLTYQCDMALAGGVAIAVPQTSGYMYQEGMIFSKDGKCRPFDENAQGTVMSNGIGVIVLKRLQDAINDKDHITAVIKGYGLNNDGLHKMSYSAPSIDGQAAAIASAISMANIDPETIGYVEAHGTGTILGDPIEIEGLIKAFDSHKNQYCAIGSVKSNIGHTFEASGVIGLIKAALSLHHKKIPPSLHFNKSNPHIDFKNSPFYVNTSLQSWEKTTCPRRAAISSFGIGGTNAHAILEEWSQPNQPDIQQDSYALQLSAKSHSSLKQLALALGQHLQEHPSLSLSDVAYTLQTGRKVFKHRCEIVCHNLTEATSFLLNFDPSQHSSTFTNKPDILGCRIPLPTYPFEKKYHWIEPYSHEDTNSCNTSLLIPNTIDLVVSQTFQEFLGKDDIEEHDDFFDLGGDSLMAIEVAARLSTHFNIELGMPTLLAYPTIAKLSDMILQHTSSNHTTIRLKQGKDKTPLFLIHPIEGTLFCYKDLLTYLNTDTAVYGIHATTQKSTSIEELAERYLQEIRKIQPKGPYHILGASFGGILAYEITQQLQESNDVISLLCILDAANPTTISNAFYTDKERLSYLLKILEDKPVPIADITPDRVIQSLHLTSLSKEEQFTIFERVKLHLQLLSSYKPKPYKGKALFFQSAQDSSGWIKLIHNIKIHSIPGQHLNMLKSSNIQLLTKCIEMELSEIKI